MEIIVSYTSCPDTSSDGYRVAHISVVDDFKNKETSHIFRKTKHDPSDVQPVA